MTDRTYQFTVLSEPEAPSTLTQIKLDQMFDAVARYEDIAYAEEPVDEDGTLVSFATLETSDHGPVRWHGAALTRAQTERLFSLIVSRAVDHAQTLLPDA